MPPTVHRFLFSGGDFLERRATLRHRVSRWLVVVVFGACVLATSHAQAHGTDANLVEIRLAGAQAFVVATPPSSTFPEFDDNHDGRLDVEEVGVHRAQILERFEADFQMADEDTVAGVPGFEDVSTPHAHDEVGATGVDHLRITLRYDWDHFPSALRVQWRKAREHPLVVTAMRFAPSPVVQEQRLLSPPETVLLDGYRPGHAFLGPLTPEAERRPSPWGMLFTAAALVAIGAAAWRLGRTPRAGSSSSSRPSPDQSRSGS